MKITDYTWQIFDIGKENKVDVGVAKDMFIANLEQKKAAYAGANDLDYAALGAQWDDLSIEERTNQRNLYNDLVIVERGGGRYHELCEVRAKGDRTAFERIVAEFVEANEAGEAE